MPEHLADEIEAVAARHGDRGEAVPKVMNADIIEPSRPTDVSPGLLNADKMSVAALGGQNVWAARLSRQLGKRAKQWQLGAARVECPAASSAAWAVVPDLSHRHSPQKYW